MTWAPVPFGSPFSMANLPFGVVRPRGSDDRASRVVVRIGDHVLDLAAAGIEPELTTRSTLNALMASERGDAIRARAADVLQGRERGDWLWPVADVEVLLPVAVGDYVDFYSSLDHATNLGRILRPNDEPLLPNWRQLPVGYHGRAGTVAASGTPVTRPDGLVAGPDGIGRLQPTAALDFELEVGFFVGGPRAARIAPDDADRHIFGAVLLNDWSARDIQSFEYQPLGPNVAKSFITSISPWVVTMDALRPFLVESPVQEPAPDPYLWMQRPWGLDLALQVDLNGHTLAATNFDRMYWTFAQQLAHTTVNGATTGAGDLFGSGTVSGPTPTERGSMIELTWRGANPIHLADGSTRSFLHDRDTVTMRGFFGEHAGARTDRVGFGDLTGTVIGSDLTHSSTGKDRDAALSS
ncbi:MAG: fumarylacetoacetase [Acidimicrobiales bacterium]|nr:fumarylacetoacetase [Acidimicrobiales bacterium]